MTLKLLILYFSLFFISSSLLFYILKYQLEKKYKRRGKILKHVNWMGVFVEEGYEILTPSRIIQSIILIPCIQFIFDILAMCFLIIHLLITLEIF